MKVKWITDYGYFYDLVTEELADLPYNGSYTILFDNRIAALMQEFEQKYNCTISDIETEGYNAECSEEDYLIIKLKCPQAIATKLKATITYD